MMMEPQAGNPNEVEGVLNPAAIRARDGQLYLFPRLVARGNFTRIGIARVFFDGSGYHIGVQSMGMPLDPEADYELNEREGMRGSRAFLRRTAKAIRDGPRHFTSGRE
jgi:hypothetical protein